MDDKNQGMTFRERVGQAWKMSRRQPFLLAPLFAAVVLIGLIVYWAIWADRSPAWTGFGAYDEAGLGTRAKTLWDWMGLLIVPLAVAIGAAVLSYIQKRTELGIAERARTQEREIAEARQRQATLEAYYDRMTELLLTHDLRQTEEGAEERSIARARTIAVVRSLDGERNRQLIAFLRASKLIEPDAPIVDLSEADLSGVDLSRADLMGANLSKANPSATDLSKANLNGAELSRANLSGANLRQTDLSGARMSRANLGGADLSTTNLSMTRLFGAILRQASLSGANLSDANLNWADLNTTNLHGASLDRVDLRQADLRQADLSGATLHDANLNEADLSQAKNCTLEQLEQANSLEAAIMPNGVRLKGPDNDGPTYEEWKAQYLAKQGGLPAQ